MFPMTRPSRAAGTRKAYNHDMWSAARLVDSQLRLRDACILHTNSSFIGASGFDGRFLQIDVAKKRRPQLIAMFARTARETHMRTSQPMIIPIITHQRERIFTTATN